MATEYGSAGYVQNDGTIIRDYIVDTEAERPTNLPAGSRVFVKETDKYYKAKSDQTVDELVPAGGVHDHNADYSAITHTHQSSGDEAFPVGAVFISVVPDDPADLLGYGTWEGFGAGRVLVGRDSLDPDFDVAEETGGAKTVTLDSTTMPSHTHTQNSHNHIQDAHNHQFLPRSATTGAVSSIVTGTLDTSSTISGANQPHNQAATATNQVATAVNQNTGGGTAHNNVQPYIVVYMWKRTA